MKFKQMNTIKSRTWVAAVAGILSITVSAVTQAAFVPVPAGTLEVPGVALAPGSSGLTGTIIAASITASTFSIAPISGGSPTTGVLRSMAVDRGAGFLDFYYQVVNTTTTPLGTGNDIWRIVNSNYLAGTTGGLIEATFKTDNLASLSNPGAAPASWNTFGTTALAGGTNAVFSADRDPGAIVSGPLGFDFDAQQFPNGIPGTGPGNVESGQISPWLVVRTNASAYTTGNAEIDTGTGTNVIPPNLLEIVPIPEPSSVIFGLALTGICLRGGVNMLRRKNTKTKLC